MATRFANIKKVAGMAAIATATTAIGLSVGSGTAQADTMTTPDPHNVIVRIVDHVNDQIGRINNRFTNRFDRNCARIDARIDRHFEGSVADRVVDHVCGTM
jgi:hypothetical protein